MSSRTRVLVMSISAPVIAFAIVGGFLGRVMAREDTYQHLKIFDDVVSLISSNYVEDADLDKVMRGAMHGSRCSSGPLCCAGIAAASALKQSNTMPRQTGRARGTAKRVSLCLMGWARCSSSKLSARACRCSACASGRP